MTKQTLVLVFQTNSGKAARITIPNPKVPTDDQTVQSAMDLIVARNIFQFRTGQIVKKVEAQLAESSTSVV